MVRWLVGIGMLLLTAVCGGFAPAAEPVRTAVPSATLIPECSTPDGRRVVALLQQYTREWDDALALASSTPRVWPSLSWWHSSNAYGVPAST